MYLQGKLLNKITSFLLILTLFFVSGCEINNSTNFIKSILIDTQLEKHDIKSVDYQLENERYNIFIQYPELQ